jgi:hypothetical protein
VSSTAVTPTAELRSVSRILKVITIGFDNIKISRGFDETKRNYQSFSFRKSCLGLVSPN